MSVTTAAVFHGDILVIGTDEPKPEYEIVDKDDDTKAIDVTGWEFSWMVKRDLGDLDAAAVITKTTPSGITIPGTFNAVRAINTQRVRVDLQDADTDGKTAGYVFGELKRTGAGVERVVDQRKFALVRAVHRS